MKTILYNSVTEKVISKIFEDGYKVDGQHKTVLPPVYELEYIETPQPVYDAETEKISYEWVVDLNDLTYTQTWTITGKSAYEIAMDDWKHAEYAKRIIAPAALVMDDTGLKMLGWFQINNLPVELRGDNVYLYCNQILAQHQGVVDSLQGVITIEDKPIE